MKRNPIMTGRGLVHPRYGLPLWTILHFHWLDTMWRSPFTRRREREVFPYETAARIALKRRIRL